MAYEVIWSDEAESSFQSIIEYLKIFFSEKEISRFITETSRKIEFIGNNPLMYRSSSRSVNIHYTNILGKVLLVYRIVPHSEVVELIHFWDGRQNPRLFNL